MNAPQRLTPEAQRWIRVFTWAVILSYALPWLAFIGRVGPRDYDQFLVFHELQYWNAALFGLAKQWSPVMCAGLSLAGEPQVPFLSLSMLLGYGLGPLPGLELAIALYFLIGWCGAWAYAGLWLPNREQRALAAALFIGNGFFICRYGFGHIDFVPFLALPMMLWTLHMGVRWTRQEQSAPPGCAFALATLLLGAGLAMVVDGSPVAIIHLFFWVALYSAVLALTARTFAPLLMMAGAAVAAALLDAGYLWPMLDSQADFPRLTPDTFTNPLALPWFALLPLRGKLITPANGNGHELSVYIGPIVAALLWRYRRTLLESLPREMKIPLIVVSIVCVWLGMGSLRPLHIPVLLSPFDLLRPLPGFRSLGVTGRYWGFLALPLSLLGAAALWRFLADRPKPLQAALVMFGLLLFQLEFQLESIISHWTPASAYDHPTAASFFRETGEDITFVTCRTRQGALITPTRAVINCYDNDDFIRADVQPGAKLIKTAARVGSVQPLAAHATFQSWNNISIRLTAAPSATVLRADPHERAQIVLNQAWHSHWHSPDCRVSRAATGNMTLDCSLARLQQEPITLTFRDRVSDVGALVSRASWSVWVGSVALLLLFVAGARMRARILDSASRGESP